MTWILHGYWRSGTSYRTRIALNLKGVAYQTAPVDLRAGDQRTAAFLALNPQGLVPALEVDGVVLTQSTAILEWLEETRPEPPLLPRDPLARARVRAMAAAVACDVHPLNNLRVLRSIRQDLHADDAQLKAWPARWTAPAFKALEAMIGEHGGAFSYGDTPTLADCCLIPQVYSAQRFEVDLAPYPQVRGVAARAAEHPAFAAAHPDRQPDADRKPGT